ncbi:hypothetical protein D3C72_1639910 [compost metagenome]
MEIPSHQAALDALARHVSTGIGSLDHAEVCANQSSHCVLIVTAYNSAAGVRIRDQTVVAAHQPANHTNRMQGAVVPGSHRTACGRFANYSSSPVAPNQTPYVIISAAIYIARCVAAINQPGVVTDQAAPSSEEGTDCRVS